ncbi:hypothetical protein K9M79_01110 [Candidatus Woesearchaeota archaeon]|nr:hypothetical protein [Candidatus Woesearchaeota archaeon]
MFDFLKKFFKKEETVIKRSKLEEFINGRLKSFEGNMKDRYRAYKKKITELRDEIEDKCIKLEKATLRNENIPARAINIMNGNRSAFVKSVRLLMEQVKGREFESTNISKLSDHARDMDNMLDAYNKSTKKSYFVLQEFFANESGDIAKSIKKLDLINKEFTKEVEDSEYFRYLSIKELLDSQRNKNNKILELKKKNKRKLEALRNAKLNLKNIKSEVQAIRQSSEYESLKNLDNTINESYAKRKKIADGIYHKFSPLSRALRKYAKISIDAGISTNIESDVVDAIGKHSAGQIRTTLDGLKRSIESGSLSLKDNVKEKNLALLSEISIDWISKHKKDLEECEKIIINAKEEVNKSDLQNTLNDLSEKIERKKEEIVDIQKVIDAVENEISKSDSHEIEDKIKISLNNMEIILE